MHCGSQQRFWSTADASWVRVPGAGRRLGAVRQAELDHAFPVQLVEQLELTGQLVGLLPLGGEFCSFLVIVVVRQVLARVGVPSEGPEAVEVDLIAYGRGQRVHEDPGAEAFGRQVFGLPVSAW